ncbi:TrmH family RNA methyltransferase [Aeribacillus pallidus]|jgi:tRNA (guanosine-2'-O-)-methyltransferase|uniref:TrmH family RNA methyltransferase n=1 Tax=Aeribacillus pallidus TaxID=33936 RepID=UPI003D1A7DED
MKNVKTNHSPLKQQLIEEQLLLEDNRVYWEMINDERMEKLYRVLNERTRYISLLLEGVDDGHNQAAVLRTADAFGVQDVTIVRGRAPFQPNVNITKSADKWLTIKEKPTIVEAIRDYQQAGYQVFATDLSEKSVYLEDVDVSKPTVLLFGNEHAGISDDARNAADGTFVIPMKGFVQSLNISVAAAITLHYITNKAKEVAKERYYLTLEEKQELLKQWVHLSVPKKLRAKLTES